MANQKAELHNIPLKTMDVCLNKYDHDIKPYSGFRKNNSPFYGNLLSPFYGESYESLGSKSWVNRKGEMYYLDGSGRLTLKSNVENQADITLGTANNFITKETIETSGNATYPLILAFVEAAGGITYEMVCANPANGRVAIIASNGSIVREAGAASDGAYIDGYKVHFAVSASPAQKAYCFAIGDSAYVFGKDGTFAKIYSSQVLNTKIGCYVHYTDLLHTAGYFLLCKTGDVPYTVALADATVTLVTRINYYMNLTSLGYGTQFSGENYFWDKKGKCHRNLSFFRNESPDAKLYRLEIGHIVAENASTLRFTTWYDMNDPTINGIQYITKTDATSYNEDRIHEDGQERTYCDYYGTTYIMSYLQQNTTPADNKDTIIAKTYLRSFTYSVPEKSLREVDYSYIEYNPVTKKNEIKTKKIFVETVDSYSTKSTTASTTNETSMPAKNILWHLYHDGMVFHNPALAADFSLSIEFQRRIEGNIVLNYLGGEISALSIADGDNAGTLITGHGGLDNLFPIVYTGYRIFFKDSQGWQKVTLSSAASDASLVPLNNRYILINTNKYLNCFDTETHTWHHFASDYMDRALWYFKTPRATTGVYTPGLYTWAALIEHLQGYYSASAINPFPEVSESPFVSFQEPAHLDYDLQNPTDLYIEGSYTPDNDDVDIFQIKSASGTDPVYLYTIKQYVKDSRYIKASFVNKKYIASSNQPVSLFAKFTEGSLNKSLIEDSGYTYPQETVNNTKKIFAVNISNQIMNKTDGIFVIQSAEFLVIDGIIYRYENDKPTQPLVNVTGMKLIGSNPYMALFWSPANRTIYRYTGDIMLEPLVQADEIEDIYESGYNPTTGSIYAVTDKSLLIFSQDHLVKVDKDILRFFPTDLGGFVVDSNSTHSLIYNNVEGLEPVPIELETECYGLGNSVKSVNDCVYIRLFDEDTKEGMVKVSSETLNETSKVADEKVFNITKDKWDKNSKTIFLRYQPKFQAATGFSVKIKSPFAIASLQISATPETVQNSKYNV